MQEDAASPINIPLTSLTRDDESRWRASPPPNPPRLCERGVESGRKHATRREAASSCHVAAASHGRQQPEDATRRRGEKAHPDRADIGVLAPPELAAQMARPLCGFRSHQAMGPNSCQPCDANMHPNPYEHDRAPGRGRTHRDYQRMRLARAASRRLIAARAA
jgi:hypothetical protein